MSIINPNDAPLISVNDLTTESMRLKQIIGQHVRDAVATPTAITFNGIGWQLTIRSTGDGMVELEGNYISNDTIIPAEPAEQIPYSVGVYSTDTVNSNEGNYITKIAFRNRFTIEERAYIELAGVDIPSATQEQRFLQASIRAMLSDMVNADFVDLASERVVTGTNQLEQFGLLAAGRANQILTSPIQAQEVFKG